jgi:predicted dithiol-disulfide oxidoreductase (DUF899 family)
MFENHSVVTKEQWLAARTKLLAREKELSRLRDELSAERRALPWQRVEKHYLFQTESGPKTLAELFGDKQQLIVQHVMFAPSWEQACKSCSFWADNYNGVTEHLAHRDISFVAVSRAPLAKLQTMAERLGWTFPWISSGETDFNFDYEVSFRPEQQGAGKATYNYAPTTGSFEEREGTSVFYKDARGDVFHTYSCYARGIEPMNGTYALLDLVPKGRDEASFEYPMGWLRHRDQYER